MATNNDSSIKFFSKGTSNQWLFVLSQYKEVFKLRAQATRGSKKSGPQEAIKLDNWYQDELPKILQARKDKFLLHEELVQITKWKLWRTKNRAGLLCLVRMNTELAVKQVTTKAFKKCLTNLQSAITALVSLKGIGVATASAVLCAIYPEVCPFMADECLDSVPGIENTNYTVNEFIAFADQIKACCNRLQAEDPTAKWTPHKVELALWTHYWIKEMKLNLLDEMPTPEGLEDETEETGSDDVVNESKNNGDSHVKLSSASSTSINGDKVLDEDDSNISVPVSNTSEVEDDDSRSVDELGKSNNNNNNGTGRMNINSNSAYNCIEDSKDGMSMMMRNNEDVSSIVDDNSRQQLISNGDNSNLSYSNLSSDDLNNSTTENTADNTMDGPTNLTTTTNIISNSIYPISSTSNTNITTTNNLSDDVTSTLLPPAPSAPVAVSVEITEPVETSINNGHTGSNGENCKDNNEKIDSEMIISDGVCSSIDGDQIVSSKSLKRPLEEIITSSGGDKLEDNQSTTTLDKRSRID